MGRNLAWSLGALALVGLVAYGARGSLGLFIHPWEEEFGASRGAVSLVSSIGFVALGLAQPLAGRLLEAFEARSVLFSGLALSAVGFAGGAFAGELWVAVVLVGALAAFGGGLASISTLSYLAAELVARRQGMIFGILTAATAGGQVVVLPLATAALGVSLRAALLALALTLAAAAVAVLSLVPRVAPAPRADGEGRRASLLADARFWLLALPFFVCGYTTTGLTDTHLIPYAVDHHVAEATAAAALATLAAFNVAGVLLGGVLTDRVDRGSILAVVYAARAVSLLVLPLLTSSSGLFLFAVLFGLADFVTVPPTVSLTRSIFRAGGWAVALGLIFGTHQAGSALGAYLGGWLYDQTGTYAYSFTSAAAALFVASLLSYALSERAGLTGQPSRA